MLMLLALFLKWAFALFELVNLCKGLVNIFSRLRQEKLIRWRDSPEQLGLAITFCVFFGLLLALGDWSG